MLDTTELKNPEGRLYKEFFYEGVKAIAFLNLLKLGTIVEIQFRGGYKHLVQKKWIKTSYNDIIENDAFWVYTNGNHSNLCPVTEAMLKESTITIRDDVMEAFNLIITGYQFVNNYYK